MLTLKGIAQRLLVARSREQVMSKRGQKVQNDKINDS